MATIKRAKVLARKSAVARTAVSRGRTQERMTAAQGEDLDRVMMQQKLGWTWYYGKVTGLGYFSAAGGREVSILWDDGRASRQQGLTSDEQWEIFKLAFAGTGGVCVISDKPDPDWRFDYRYLEARK